MAKPTKEQKRKAKLKAKKQQAIHNQQSLTERLSIALEKLCEPVLPEYIDDSRGPDLTGRSIVAVRMLPSRGGCGIFPFRRRRWSWRTGRSSVLRILPRFLDFSLKYE